MEISRKDINLKGIPAVMWGTPSQKLTLYIHGQGGSKEEAVDIAETICGFDSQILSLDLPEHGERKDARNCFVPSHQQVDLSHKYPVRGKGSFDGL